VGAGGDRTLEIDALAEHAGAQLHGFLAYLMKCSGVRGCGGFGSLVNPSRPCRSYEQLRESYAETLDALRRRFEQLEWAVAQFQPDLDEQAFSTAWHSDDPSERNRADGVLSGFEKTYMLLMDLITLSVKLAGRLDALKVDEGASSVEVLRELRVVSQTAQVRSMFSARCAT
jgi:hypothetical protein